jgi:hypothetical protein
MAHYVVIRRVSSEDRGAEIFRRVFPDTHVPEPQQPFMVPGTGDYQGHRTELINAFEDRGSRRVVAPLGCDAGTARLAAPS